MKRDVPFLWETAAPAPEQDLCMSVLPWLRADSPSPATTVQTIDMEYR